VQTIKDGKYSPVQSWYWWFKSPEELQKFLTDMNVEFVGGATAEFLKFEKDQ
jgi:hypothetical protein